MNKKLIVILFILFFVIWILYTNFSIEVNTIEITNNKIPNNFDGFKMAHVSDLHNHNWKGKLAEKIKKEDPNIIVITGDLIDSSKTNINVALEFINKVSKIAPIYFVTGNHEAWSGNDYNILKEELEKSEVNILDDKSMFIEIDKEKVQILGLQDPEFKDQNNNEGLKTLENLINKDYFNVVLSHRPEYFKNYVKSEADLVLAGHAHGGQVRIPFLGGLIASNQGLFPHYTEGIYREAKTDMIVSRGLGNSIFPVRINNTPELVIVKLKSVSIRQSKAK